MKDLSGRKILGVEGDIQIRTDKLYIYGKYDLITEDTDKTLTLWDWKTNVMPAARLYDEFRNQKIQLGIYAVWMTYKYHLKNVKATAVFFGEGVEQISETFSKGVEKDVLDFLAAWRKRLNKVDTFPPLPNNLCKWCEWYPICPAFEEQRHAAGLKGEFPKTLGLDSSFRPYIDPRREEDTETPVCPADGGRDWMALALGLVVAAVLFAAMFWNLLVGRFF